MLNFNAQKIVQGPEIFHSKFMTEASDKSLEQIWVVAGKNNIIHIEEKVETTFRP